MQSPEVLPLGPFATIPSSGPAGGIALAAYPRWLVRGVRAEGSVQAWTRTGRLRRLALLSLVLLLSKRLTVSIHQFD